MIETQLRAAFDRAEQLVPDIDSLRSSIAAEVRRRRSRRRFFRSGAAGLAVLVAIALPVAGRAWWGHSAAPQAPVAPPAGALDIVLAGLDGPHEPDPQRSDSLFIVHIPADRASVYLVSVPRNLDVELPGHGRFGINAAYALGAMPLLERSLSTLTGAQFEATVTVEMSGLRRLVDALGGVNLCVDQRTTSMHTGQVFVPGCRHFTGAEAMDYLRQRQYSENGIHHRDRHIAQFLDALLTQLRSADAFLNPVRLAEIIAIVRANTTVDARQLDLTTMLSLGGGVESTVLVNMPVVESSGALDDGRSQADPRAEGLFAALRADTLDRWVAANPSSAQRLR